MKHYIEITLLPNPEVGLFFLWTKVLTQVHIALVERQDQTGRVPIGVSFPEYIHREKHAMLGSKLRLFAASEAILNQMDVQKHLDRLHDYVHITSVRNVPEQVKNYAIYQRVHLKTNAQRLARRYAKRHQISIEQALMHYAGYKDDESALPYIQLKSLSNGQNFRLIIAKKSVTQPQELNMSFNSFGLSGMELGTPVPEF